MARSAAIALLATALVSGAASADPATARAHYNKGTSAFALGRYAEAAGEYEKAFEAKPDPALLYNAAQAHRLAGNKPRALLLYQNYVRVFGRKVANREAVEEQIALLERAVESDRRTANAPPLALAPPEEKPEPLEEKPEERRAAPAAALPHDEPPADEPKPLLKRPLFWVAAVAVVAAIAAGITIGAVLATSGPRDPMPTWGVVMGN